PSSVRFHRCADSASRVIPTSWRQCNAAWEHATTMSVRASNTYVLWLALPALAMVGCALDEPPAESTVQSALTCSMMICGENAATAGDGLLFDELDLFGRANYAGVALLGANLGSGLPVRIQIMRDRLYAIDPATSNTYWGPDLIYTQLHLVHIPSGE